MSPAQLREVKAALIGKALTADGTAVDHTSSPSTPHMKLYVVTYNRHIPILSDDPCVSDGTIDGASFWISGPSQDAEHANLTAFVHAVRAATRRVPSFGVWTGAYLEHSHTGMLSPAPFYDLLRQSIALYDEGLIGGCYLFAGSTLARMNASHWAAVGLPAWLDGHYQPHLGAAELRVLDAETGAPLHAALTTVHYGTPAYGDADRRAEVLVARGALVTRKAGSTVAFGGWAGTGGSGARHTAYVTAPGYTEAAVQVDILAGKTSPYRVTLSKEGGKTTPL